MKNNRTGELPVSSKKSKCPQCGELEFKGYVYPRTKEYIAAEYVGRCERIFSCGYHYPPRKYFSDNNISPAQIEYISARFRDNANQLRSEAPIDFIPYNEAGRSVLNFKNCDLYPYLVEIFGAAATEQLCKNYFIGAYDKGFTAFWQLDAAGNVRQCKVISYKSDGHRNKTKVFRSWVDHKTGQLHNLEGVFYAGKEILRKYNVKTPNLQQCFFGEYQLIHSSNNHKAIAIVESEKTAAIASMYHPEMIWLATGGIEGCKWTQANVCKVLKGRRVVLYPDLGAFDIWNKKASFLSSVAECKVVVSDLLENISTPVERKQQLDIADYLLKKERDAQRVA